MAFLHSLMFHNKKSQSLVNRWSIAGQSLVNRWSIAGSIAGQGLLTLLFYFERFNANATWENGTLTEGVQVFYKNKKTIAGQSFPTSLTLSCPT
jgi:hypothetical protein